MKYSLVAALALVVTAGTLALRAEDPAPAPALDTLEKRVGYAVGFNMGTSMKQQGANLDVDSIMRGLKDAMAGVAPVISQQGMQQAMQEFGQKLNDAAMRKREDDAKKNVADGAAFLEKNKAVEGVKVTASGLQYKQVKAGNGQKPAAADTVTVNYEGTLIDGTVFDSSYARGEPATFPLGRVIKGWTEGLQLMDVGSTYMLYIPSELAYGANPPPRSSITPNAVLIFKVELIEIKKGE